MDAEQLAANILGWGTLGLAIILTLISLPSIARSNPLYFDGIPTFLKRKKGKNRISLKSNLPTPKILAALSQMSNKPINDIIPGITEDNSLYLITESHKDFVKVCLWRKNRSRPGSMPVWYLMASMENQEGGSIINGYYK